MHQLMISNDNEIQHKLSLLVRSNIRELVRLDRSSDIPEGYVRLHANESPYNMPESRYPEAQPAEFIARWGSLEGINPRCCYVCNGTEEAVDLTLRIFCRPGIDKVIVPHPTRSIYERRALCNDVECIRVPLGGDDFNFKADTITERLHRDVKVIFLCNPNSPTGNILPTGEIKTLAEKFSGILVVDESYIEFSPQNTAASLINGHWNVVILRSFSHARAAAGIRLGMVVAHPALIPYFIAAGMSHPVSIAVRNYAESLSAHHFDTDKWVRQIINERAKVAKALAELSLTKKVYPSAANFLLVEVENARAVHQYLMRNRVAVAAYPQDVRLENCFRVTISLPNVNSQLLGLLRRYDESREV